MLVPIQALQIDVLYGAAAAAKRFKACAVPVHTDVLYIRMHACMMRVFLTDRQWITPSNEQHIDISYFIHTYVRSMAWDASKPSYEVHAVISQGSWKLTLNRTVTP